MLRPGVPGPAGPGLLAKAVRLSLARYLSVSVASAGSAQGGYSHAKIWDGYMEYT